MLLPTPAAVSSTSQSQARMTEPPSRLLTTATRVTDAVKLPRAETFPPLLLQQSVRRVRTLALISLCLVLVIWVLKGAIDGSFFYDLGRFAQWAPPTLISLNMPPAGMFIRIRVGWWAMRPWLSVNRMWSPIARLSDHKAVLCDSCKGSECTPKLL